jgi:hypothetical protein
MGEVDELRQEFLLQGIEDFVACAILVQLRQRHPPDRQRSSCRRWMPVADDTVEA